MKQSSATVATDLPTAALDRNDSIARRQHELESPHRERVRPRQLTPTPKQRRGHHPPNHVGDGNDRQRGRPSNDPN